MNRNDEPRRSLLSTIVCLAIGASAVLGYNYHKHKVRELEKEVSDARIMLSNTEKDYDTFAKEVIPYLVNDNQEQAPEIAEGSYLETLLWIRDTGANAFVDNEGSLHFSFPNGVYETPNCGLRLPFVNSLIIEGKATFKITGDGLFYFKDLMGGTVFAKEVEEKNKISERQWKEKIKEQQEQAEQLEKKIYEEYSKQQSPLDSNNQ